MESNGVKKYFSLWKYIEGKSLEAEWDSLSADK